jgi:pyruvate-ferredoxin/flavodoxin oxidoreductase
MYWANATGCSQAWGASMPSIPYTVNKDGRGPAWSNSLFEDNAEFGLGLALSMNHTRMALRAKVDILKELLVANDAHGDILIAIDRWNKNFDDYIGSQIASAELLIQIEKKSNSFQARHPVAVIMRELLASRTHFTKKSVWMFGGDGWAYDIGYGGLDHVFAMGADVNVLVVDTEVYSNTGAQSSKATPLGASVKFQTSGKKTKKKDLGLQMMTYGDVYVAQVAMGADPAQLMKALIEAESYPGPSLVIAYAPCIAHGIKLGMDNTMEEMKRAVDAGYWYLYRYDPRNERAFKLDSKAPTRSFSDFLDGEIRYASLKASFPENAEKLFAQAEKDAVAKYRYYKKLEEGGI